MRIFRTTIRVSAALLLLASGLLAAPRLRLSETAIGPVSIAAGQNGETRSVDATNAGDGTLNLTLRSSATWLEPTQGASRPCAIFGGSTGSCIPINLGFRTASLEAGLHTAIVTLSDPNAVDAPQTITVTVAIGGTVPSTATLFVSTQAGSRDTARVITNSIITGTPSTTSGGAWLSLAFEGNGTFAFTLPYAITARNPGGLAEGNYDGRMVVTDSKFAPDNKTVNVQMRVTSQPIITLSRQAIRVRLAQGAPAGPEFILASNRGLGNLALGAIGVTLANGEGWMNSAVIAGTNFVQVNLLPGSLPAGLYRGSIAINSNAANGVQTVPVEMEVVARTAPVIAARGVVNNATFLGDDTLGRGTIAAIFGDQFRYTAAQQAASLPLQATLAGTRVLVNGVPAPVYYTSYGQINFQIPYNAAEGVGTVQVERDGERSNLVSVRIADRAPRLLRLGIGEYGTIVNQDGSFPVPASAGLGAAGRPARVGDTLVVYAIGLGPTSPLVASGVASPLSPLAIVPINSVVTFGNVANPYTDGRRPAFVGLTPNFVGLFQINIAVPPESPKGDRVPVQLHFDNNISSNIVEIAVQ